MSDGATRAGAVEQALATVAAVMRRRARRGDPDAEIMARLPRSDRRFRDRLGGRPGEDLSRFADVTDLNYGDWQRASKGILDTVSSRLSAFVNQGFRGSFLR